MSAPIDRVLLQTLVPIPENIREIDRDYHIEMIAQDTRQLANYQADVIRVQAEIAGRSLLMVNELAHRQNEFNNHLRQVQDNHIGAMLRDINRLNNSMDRLNETAEATLDAIYDLSEIVGENLRQISEQLHLQQKTSEEIIRVLSNKYANEAAELRERANKRLREGMEEPSRDRFKYWDHAMDLLNTTTRNPIGGQDYLVWFDIGWLQWKYKHDIYQAEKAFDEARLLSKRESEFFHIKSVRHLAHMQYLQNRYEDAYQTIQEAVRLKHNSDISYHNTLFDRARYAARTGRTEDVAQLLEMCIDLQPTTIIIMSSEKDFKDCFEVLVNVAAQKLKEARSEARRNVRHWERAVKTIKEASTKAGYDSEQLSTIILKFNEAKRNVGYADYLPLLKINEIAIKEPVRALRLAQSEFGQEHQVRTQAVQSAQTAIDLAMDKPEKLKRELDSKKRKYLDNLVAPTGFGCIIESIIGGVVGFVAGFIALFPVAIIGAIIEGLRGGDVKDAAWLNIIAWLIAFGPCLLGITIPIYVELSNRLAQAAAMEKVKAINVEFKRKIAEAEKELQDALPKLQVNLTHAERYAQKCKEALQLLNNATKSK